MATSSVEGESANLTAPILIVAALRRELAALARDPHTELVLLDTGEGPRNAERTLRAWLTTHPARAVIHIGFAGALTSSLRAGDIVVARAARFATELFDTGLIDISVSSLFQIAARIEGAHVGTAITIDEIIGEATAKQRMAATLGGDEINWVDMESAAVARVCRELKMPLLIARVISDELAEDLPIDFNRCRTADGRVSTRKVMRAVLRRPRAINGLIQLQRRSAMCADHLAAFIRRLLPLLK
jgi:adenosylhomocysteine nucleosidase